MSAAIQTSAALGLVFTVTAALTLQPGDIRSDYRPASGTRYSCFIENTLILQCGC